MLQLSNEREQKQRHLGLIPSMTDGRVVAVCKVLFLLNALPVCCLLSFFLIFGERPKNPSMADPEKPTNEMLANCYQSQIALLQIWKDCNAQKVHLTLP